MKQVVIFFLPAGATQWDFEAALHDIFASLKVSEAPPTTKAAQPESSEADELPMWTWFLPNPVIR